MGPTAPMQPSRVALLRSGLDCGGGVLAASEGRLVAGSLIPPGPRSEHRPPGPGSRASLAVGMLIEQQDGESVFFWRLDGRHEDFHWLVGSH